MIRKKRLFTILIGAVTAVTIFSGCSSKKSEASADNGAKNIIKVGTSGTYNPFTYVNADNKPEGFEIDVWNEIAKRIDYKAEFVVSEWSGLFGMLDSGKIDTIANQVTITDQRKEKYIFPDAYVYSGVQLAVKGDNTSIKSLEDLNGKKIGVDLGTNYEQAVKDFNSKGGTIKIVQYKDFMGMMQDVALGRIDAMIQDKIALVMNIDKSKLDVKIAGEPVEIMENSAPFVKNDKNKELVEKVNKAITDMRADGTLTNISKKWLNTDITQK